MKLEGLSSVDGGMHADLYYTDLSPNDVCYFDHDTGVLYQGSVYDGPFWSNLVRYLEST